MGKLENLPYKRRYDGDGNLLYTKGMAPIMYKMAQPRDAGLRHSLL
jgi:hypothetical protein